MTETLIDMTAPAAQAPNGFKTDYSRLQDQGYICFEGTDIFSVVGLPLALISNESDGTPETIRFKLLRGAEGETHKSQHLLEAIKVGSGLTAVFDGRIERNVYGCTYYVERVILKHPQVGDTVQMLRLADQGTQAVESSR